MDVVMIQEDMPVWPDETWAPRPGYENANLEEVSALYIAALAQLRAARYYVHKLRVHQYALAVLRKEMTLDQGRQFYEEAMRNYDGVIATCGSAEQPIENEMAKGADAINEALEAFKEIKNG